MGSAAGTRTLKRARRFARKLLLGPNYQQTPARCFLIFGCQRSGTSITHKVLGKSSHIQVYQELCLAAHYRPYDQTSTYMKLRFRSKEEIDRLLLESCEDVVIFKPLNESQYAEKLLDRHQAKGMWIYRNFHDVASSAVDMFGDRFSKLVNHIGDGSWGDLGWMIERMSANTIQTLQAHSCKTLSPYEGACLFWWSRNRLFLENHFFDDPRFLMLKYEDLCSDPSNEFARIFHFLEVQFQSSWVSELHASSVGKPRPPDLDQGILRLCNQCLSDLDSLYEDARLGR